MESGDVVLLPAYIGWSPREGSGVLDPITALGARIAFNRVDGFVRIDLDHLERALKASRPKAVLPIHFFGFCDPQYAEAVALARQEGALVLEDEAHAMFSDLVGGHCGRLGDAAVFSLHKLLPVPNGGVLVVNPASLDGLERLPAAGEVASADLWEHDLAEIARRRRRNAMDSTALLEPLAGRVDPLRAGWDGSDPDVPQTYPVLVRTVSRHRLYDAMNAAGFGVVALYHTLVSLIGESEFPESHGVSRQVLNLPVHQDLGRAQLDALVGHMAESIRTLEKDEA